MPTTTVPDSHRDLLDRPLFAHLATVRADGRPMSSVMWFFYDDGVIKLTHTKSRQKYRNWQTEPRVALSIADPDDEYRYVEIRGTVESIDDDDEQASFHQQLQKRYDNVYPISDAFERVIVTIRPTHIVTTRGGARDVTD